MKILKSNLSMLRLFFRAAPLYAVLNLIVVLLRTITFSVFGNVLYIKYLVDSVESLTVHPENAADLFTTLVIVTCVYYACVLLFNTVKEGVINNYLKKSAEYKVKQTFMELLFQKSIDVDMKCYDRPDYYQDMLVANQESDSRAWSVYETFVNLLDAVASGVILLAIVVQMDLVIFIFAILIHLASQGINVLKNKVNFRNYQEGLIHNRQINYVNRVFFEKQYAKDMKLTNLSHLLFEKMKTAAEGLEKVNARFGKKKAGLESGNRLVQVVLGDLVTLLYLSYQTLIHHLYSFGSMAALWNSYNELKSKTGTLIQAFQEMQDHSIYIGRFQSFMEYQNKIRSGTRDVSEIAGPLSFVFENVTFGYDPEHPVLKDFNLTIHGNERLAIVGSNGAGKSTLMKLLLRLYDPDDGAIYINGVNIREYRVDDYRKMLIGILPQNFQMYASTLAENVKMDLVEEADKDKIRYALDQTGMLKKIQGLPKSVDSDYTKEFTDDGVVFSGGEKQKIAISRLLYGSYRCIVLDEPSSALDPKAEHEMNQYIFHQADARTIIIISHRLSTTKMADRIIYIENGKVKEDGNHDRLMQLDGNYAMMFRKQAEMYQ